MRLILHIISTTFQILGILIISISFNRFLKILLILLFPHLIIIYCIAKYKRIHPLIQAIYMLNGMFLKFAQLLSTRSDIIGNKNAQILLSLQDKVPPFSHHEARKIINQSLDISIFKCFDDHPIASASIAQVHVGILLDNTKVAVKIRRPNIKERMIRDIKLIKIFCHLISKINAYKMLRLSDIAEEMDRYTRQETNLLIEAKQVQEFSNSMIINKDIRIPKVFHQYCLEHICITEWIDGITLHEAAKLYHNDPYIRSQIAHTLVNVFLKQICEFRVFHADPHPGNILLDNANNIILLDFGIVGRLSLKEIEYIIEILYYFHKKEYKKIAKIHKRAGYISSNTNLDDFAEECRIIEESYLWMTSQHRAGNLFRAMLTVAQKFGMRAQPQFLLLQKTLFTLEGTISILDNNMNVFEIALPWIQSWVQNNLGLGRRIIRVIEYLSDLYDL